MQKLSLRSVLILPYVALVVVLAVAIGSLSYYTGRQAVLTVSEHLLKETVSRIGQAIDRHVVGSVATLEAAFPNGMVAPKSIEADFDAIRTRFWIATSLHIDPNNYVYYGNKAGQAIGLYRHSETLGELRVKYKADEHRKHFQIQGINGKAEYSLTEKKNFDPRVRPWYQAGQTSNEDTWTSVYIDFGTQELVATRARQVLDSQGNGEGVVATDMPLTALNDFVSNLSISPNGLAFIIEKDGKLIASSCSKNVKKNENGVNTRINADSTGHPLLTEIYHQLQPLIQLDVKDNTARTLLFTDGTGEKIYVAFEKFTDGAGLEWINVVAMPGKDFMGSIIDNVTRTILLALVATISVVLIGLWILHWVTTDLKILSTAVNRVGSGYVEEPINIQRKDEIGDLAKSFLAMQRRLQTDYLTGLPNRYAFEQYLQAMIQRYEQQKNTSPFAVLFIDINDFKLINDKFGHEAGDQALIEFSLRLKTNIRPNDFVARFAGDEFVILLNNVQDRKALEHVKSNISNALSSPLKSFDSSSLRHGGAIGEAHFPEDAKTASELLIIADKNMYAHKAAIKKQNQNS